MSDLPPPSGDPAPPILAQFLRYAGVGAVGTALQYTLLVALVQLAGVPAVVASTAGAIAGALVNYGLNHRYTFASRNAHAHALPRFATVAATGIAVNALTMVAVLAVAPTHYLVAQVVATAVVLALGYVANRLWTF